MLQQNVHKINSLEQEKKIKEERLQQKLQKRYEKLPYSDRWAVIVPVSDVFSWVFTGYAFLIESFAIGFGIYIHYQSTISIIVGTVLGLVFGVGIEAIKRVCNYNFWNSGMSESDWNKGNLLGMVLAMVLSTGLAFWGGLNLPDATTTPPSESIPIVEDISIIRSDYDAQIATIQSNIKQFDKGAPRWKGKMSREAIKKLGDMNTELQKAMDNKNISIKDAEYRNRQKIAASVDAYNAETLLYNEYKANNGWLFAVIALMIELMIPIPFWSKERYYIRCALERSLQSTTTPIIPISTTPTPLDPTVSVNTPLDPVNIPAQPITPQTQIIPPNQAPPSGHTLPDPNTANPNINTRVIVKGFEYKENISKEAETHLSNSYTPFFETWKTTPETLVEMLKKEPEKQTEQPEKEPETIVLKNTWTHSKTTGGTVEMTIAQVRSRVAQYQEKVDDAIKRIEQATSDIDVKMWKETLSDRVKVLAYWQESERKLNKQLEALNKLNNTEHTH